ncbi:MAG: insulinase family protein [Chloroflexi bacterium]|nr:insulinase family protein [Chloroflexota bacterium]
MFQRTQIPDGPRVISARMPGARSLAVAVHVLVGSRHEARRDSGLAHFMEHITFRGTRSMPSSRAVSEAIEGVGGVSNASTGRESTVYWARLPVRHAAQAFRVLGELVTQPLLRDDDVVKERDIIVEEIRSYQDDPAQHVFDLFDRTWFGDTPLGWEIAGDEASVATLEPARIQRFWAEHYRPGRMVVAVAGDIDHDEAVALAGDALGTGPAPAEPWLPAPPAPCARLAIQRRRTAQAHLCVGLPGLPREHPDQWTLTLLEAVLGDGSSSRLFLSVREEAGLAYDVHSFQVDYADAGVLGVYAGVDPDDQEQALGAILVELARIRDERIGDAELEKARAYVSGRLELRLEDTRHVCAWLGDQEALHERVLTLDEALERLAAVTATEIQDLAGRLIRDEALSLAIISPRTGGRALDRALRLP